MTLDARRLCMQKALDLTPVYQPASPAFPRDPNTRSAALYNYRGRPKGAQAASLHRQLPYLTRSPPFLLLAASI